MWKTLKRELWIYQQIIIIFWFDNPQIVTLMEFWSRLRSFLQLLTPAISDCWMVIMNVTKDFIEIQASKTINRWNLSGMDWSGICSALVPVWYIPSCICHLISAISCQKCKMLQNVLFFSLASPIACCTQPHSQKCVFWWNPLLFSSYSMILIFRLESLYLFVFFTVLMPVFFNTPFLWNEKCIRYVRLSYENRNGTQRQCHVVWISTVKSYHV